MPNLPYWCVPDPVLVSFRTPFNGEITAYTARDHGIEAAERYYDAEIIAHASRCQKTGISGRYYSARRGVVGLTLNLAKCDES